MGLLKPATNNSAFLKAGILGFQGSGKTYTASEIAIGLCQLTKGKQAAFFDTEAGSDYMIPRFRDAGIELLVHKGRAFKDLCDVIIEAEDAKVSVLVIDSISHVWRELQDSYKRRVKRNSLYMQDWGILKGQWGELTDLYLNSRLHIIMLGRAGYEYEHEENEATGKKEMIKSGTKMKVEGEMAYEPSLLIEMESHKEGKRIINRATVLKDRSDKINGKQFDSPKFQDFMPVIEFLNIGGEHVGVDTTRTSEELFETPDRSYEERKRKHAIALEQLQELLVIHGLAGTGKEEQKKRTELLIEVFGSSSKTFIEEKLTLQQVQDGLNKIRARFDKPPVDLTPGTVHEVKNLELAPHPTSPTDQILVQKEPKDVIERLKEKHIKPGSKAVERAIPSP